MGDSNEKANKKVRNEKLFQREKKKEGEESGRRVKKRGAQIAFNIYIFFSSVIFREKISKNTKGDEMNFHSAKEIIYERRGNSSVRDRLNVSETKGNASYDGTNERANERIIFGVAARHRCFDKAGVCPKQYFDVVTRQRTT